MAGGCLLQIETNPTRCFAICGQQLDCGHTCSGLCGACLRHRQTQAKGQPEAAAAEPGAKHLPCQHICSKPLVCGHPCTKTCHPSTEPCSGCSRKCPMHCVHGRCGLDCSKVCTNGCNLQTASAGMIATCMTSGNILMLASKCKCPL